MLQPVFTRRPAPRGKVRVGLVCPYSLDVPGGVQNHVRDLAEVLLARGHEVGVLAPGERPTPSRPTSSSPAGPSPVPYNGSVARLAFGPRVAARTTRWLREGDFDLVHVHEPLSPSVSVLALWAGDVPIVATFHTANLRSRTLARVASVLRPSIEKIAARIAVSEAARVDPGPAPRRRAGRDPERALLRPSSRRPSPSPVAAAGTRGRVPRPHRRTAQGARRAARRVADRAGRRPREPAAGGGSRRGRPRRRAAADPEHVDVPRTGRRRDRATAARVGHAVRRTADQGRELRHRAGRGDGGRRARGRQRPARLPCRARRRPGGEAVPHGRRCRPAPTRWSGCCAIRTSARRRGRPGRAVVRATTGAAWLPRSSPSTRRSSGRRRR